MLSSSNRDKPGKYELVILGTALAVCLFLVISVQVFYGIDIVYTHFFYLPIIIIGIWYHKRALWVAGLLGLFHIAAGYVSSGAIVPSTLTRSAMFMVVALVIGVISERKDRFFDELQKSKEKLQQQYYDLETQHQELQQKKNEIGILFEAAQLVNSSLNVRQVLENIVNLAQKVMEFDAGGIFLFDRDSWEKVGDAVYNYSPEEVAGLIQCRAFHDLLELLKTDHQAGPVEGRFTCSLVSKTEMAVGMVINSNVYGIWFVENHQEDRFTSDHKKMLAALANLTSSAVKNAWLYEQTTFEASIDRLTGLFNRQYFDRILEIEKEKARMVQTPLSLIMADLNRLKYINDTFGHETGDYIIREAAAILRKSVRKGELIFRFGGDEMVILLPDSDYHQTAGVVQRIRNNAQAWNEVNNDKRLFLHLSIGWSTAQTPESLEELVRIADEEMYRDKTEYYISHGLVRTTQGPR